MGILALMGSILAIVGVVIFAGSLGVTIASAFPGQAEAFASVQILNITTNGAGPFIAGIIITIIGAGLAAVDR